MVGGARGLETCGAEATASSLMAGDLLCLRSTNAVHIKASEAYGCSLVALSPGNKVGINVGYCCAVRILTNSIAIVAEGDNGPPFSTVLATTTRSTRK